jgi:hypothetical protein
MTLEEFLMRHAIRTHKRERLVEGFPTIPLEIDGKLVVPITVPELTKLINAAEASGHPHAWGSELLQFGFRGWTIGNMIVYGSVYAEPITAVDVIEATKDEH